MAKLQPPILLAPLPRPGDVAGRRDERERERIAQSAPRLLVVHAIAAGLVTLKEQDGSVIDQAVPWLGAFPPQVGDRCIRLALPGRGARAAAPSYIAIGPIRTTDTGPDVVDREGSATAAATATNASTATYVTALSVTIPLGPGLWQIVADGDVALKHSGSGGADLRVDIDGTATAKSSQNLSSTVWSRWGASRRSTAVAGNRSVTVQLLYKAGDAGTVSAANPVLRVRAMRMAT